MEPQQFLHVIFWFEFIYNNGQHCSRLDSIINDGMKERGVEIQYENVMEIYICLHNL